jgi:hypothetical protein
VNNALNASLAVSYAVLSVGWFFQEIMLDAK